MHRELEILHCEVVPANWTNGGRRDRTRRHQAALVWTKIAAGLPAPGCALVSLLEFGRDAHFYRGGVPVAFLNEPWPGVALPGAILANAVGAAPSQRLVCWGAWEVELSA